MSFRVFSIPKIYLYGFLYAVLHHKGCRVVLRPGANKQIYSWTRVVRIHVIQANFPVHSNFPIKPL